MVFKVGTSQNMHISGTITDTALNLPIKNAVITVSRINDSILLAYKRSDANGYFEFSHLPIDTVKVSISNKGFGDQTYYLFARPTNYEFGFGKVILPPKTTQLKEVIIYAYKDPVYYKGDTLIYAADSFKVKPNATVEDLLKKLPGISVNADGKITAQGKKIDQVLVDGDEFFGNDATNATKNIVAKGVESVKVYEKKNENAKEGEEEKIQVMDLRLKENFKKGYFSRVSAASDFQKFYNGELLMNRFKESQKISVYALASNTPSTGFNIQDAMKYGLDNELSSWSDGGRTIFTMDNVAKNAGIPQTLKSGFYYTDQLGKKTKLKMNYSFNSNKLAAFRATRSQYFLIDTNYSNNNVGISIQQIQNNFINTKITQTLDSLTTLEIEPKLRFDKNSMSSYESTIYTDAKNTQQHQNNFNNNSKSNGYELNTSALLIKKFKKKDRLFKTNYNYSITAKDAKGVLASTNTFYNASIKNDSINQQKINSTASQTHNLLFTYVEPLTQKVRLEFDYLYINGTMKQDRQSYHLINNEFTGIDSLLSNQFKNNSITNRMGIKFIYEIKKQTLEIGGRYNNIFTRNLNETTQKKIAYNVSNVLPSVSYMYKPTDNSRINIRYVTYSSQPSINQLQSVPDNSNPNQINIGNPNLLPTYNQSLRFSYGIYKALSDNHIWINGVITDMRKAFTNEIYYDSIGRSIIKTINSNGNYNASLNAGGGISFFSRVFKIFPNLGAFYNVSPSFINYQKNITKNLSLTPALRLEIDIDTLQFNVTYDYTYNAPVSSLNKTLNKPYSQHKITASLFLKLPLKFSIDTDVTYVINNKRAVGYNINYVLLNASINKTFFKTEDLVVSVVGNDILNQNINTNREIQDNVIIDSKTNVISRYFLLKLVYKFNSAKTKENDLL
ncbi:MAG: TonB-dependent receptor [Bacteroidia bacterium]